MQVLNDTLVIPRKHLSQKKTPEILYLFNKVYEIFG